MTKTFFVVAAGSAIAALLCGAGAVGCVNDASPSSPAETDATADAERSRANESDGGEQVAHCWKDDPVDLSHIAYKPARVRPGACGSDVFAAIGQATEEGATDYPQLKEGLASHVSAECVACIFGDEREASWAPIILNEAGSALVDVNVGGCYEVKSGSTACGEAAQKWYQCLYLACSGCSFDQTETCIWEVQETACLDITSKLVTACGAGIDRYLDECQSVEHVVTDGSGGSIQALCVDSDETADGGTDAADAADAAP